MNLLYRFSGLIFSVLWIQTSLLLAQGNYVVNTSNNSDSGIYGNFNVLVGPGAGSSGSMTGLTNTMVGYQAGQANTTGDANVFTGTWAGQANTTGDYNVFTGYYAGYANTTGGYNVFTGISAGSANTTGGGNTFIGSNAGRANTTGGFNLFSGYGAGYSNSTGEYNVFSGTNAGWYNTTGGSNTFTGSFAGNSNTAGNNNVFSGSQSGWNNTTGSNNIFMGFWAGYYNTTGNNNILIGPFSGTAITTGNDNVLMGYNSQAEDGLRNATAIGANSRVSISNAVILGNQANVGIGTSAPNTRLEVVSESADDSGLRLSHLTSQSKPTQSTDHFLTVNEKGDVVKARYQLRITSANEWSDHVFAPTYSLRPLSSVASYIGQHGHLPDVPSAEQVAREGVDLAQLNATLLKKIEELTLYSIALERANREQKEANQHLAQQQQQTAEQQQAEINHLKVLVSKLLEKK
ncbi:hypothetical protein IC229_16875 [Spirosoma sp. BT702]|uniref:TMF family protein n=1 Tax=Spirosoma profusum TaxID=2771354 RepID=A0A926XY43_9BACT|nr:hypothetical protein [Spirosoma profusum]MBD2702325.1 hypothetical protein [Spirosoma profusum]